MRKCRLATCRKEIPSIKISDFAQSKGFCDLDHMSKHGLAKARATINRQRKAKHREEKERIKTRQDWLREAQSAVNAYVRERDRGKPCISCDKPDNGLHQRHASHYRSVKACSILRFNLRNIHASCATCNAVLSGNLLEYRIRLVRMKGSDFVEWLENQNQPITYSVEYLKRVKSIFLRRTRIAKRRREK